MLASIAHDLAYAVRTLRRAPVFTIVAILTLALGIGANTAIFSVINGVLLKPLPYANGDEIIHIVQPVTAGNIEDAGFSATEIADYRAQATALESVVEYHSMSFNMIGRGEPHRVQTGVVSANYFDALGVNPMLGRAFRPGEDEPGAPPVVILAYDFWRTRLGGDPTIVGQTVEMTDRVHTVIGVLPPLPQFPNENDVFMPVHSCPFRSAEGARTNRGARFLTMFALVRDGASADRVETDLTNVAGRLHQEYPQAYPEARGFGVRGVPLREELVADARPTLFLLIATAAFVLVIACANVANLTLVRLTRRRQELVLRTAIGAGRGRIIRQLLTESAVLALAGAALGLLLAYAGEGMLAAYAARFTPRAQEIGIDLRVFGFAVLAAVTAALVFGTLPAVTIVRNLAASLRARGGSGSGMTRARRRLEHGLVVAQLAVTVVLLAAAGLATRSLLALRSVDAGFDPGSVLTMRLTPSRDTYTTADLRRGFNDDVLARVRAMPGVRSAALSTSFPLLSGQPFSVPFLVEGRPLAADEPPPQAEVRIASEDYFTTIGVPVLRGRTFGPEDRAESVPAALVNRSLAQRLWPSADPVGQRLSLNGGQTWVTIIGVIGDIRHHSLEQEPVDEIHVPYAQFAPGGGALLVRTTGDPARHAQPVLDAIRAIDVTVPVDRIQTLDEVRDSSMAARRLTTMLLLLFAGLALAIAAVGIGGVLAFSVSQRTQEIGIRMALGASRSDVLTGILRQGGTLVGLGLAIGIAGALALARLMSGFVFGVGTVDPITLGVVCAVLGVVAMLASLGPAQRASTIQPAAALQGE